MKKMRKDNKSWCGKEKGTITKGLYCCEYHDLEVLTKTANPSVYSPKREREYKIVETDLFKQQKEELPKEVRKELDKALKSISDNPTEAPHSMSLFGKPSAKELKQWASDINVSDIDIILEYLSDKECLNKSGKKLAHQFWEEYIKEDDN